MSKKYILIIVITLIAAVIATVGITVFVGKPEILPPDREQNALQTDKKNEDPFCVLVLGKDRASGLTDVIMLVSFDPAKDRISVMQIPRDTYAEYGAKSHNKINGALAELGGADKLEAFFERTLGVSIDGHLTLDLDAFREIVDTLGGVEIELDAPLRYSDPSQKLYIDLPRGKQVLDGKQAEMYVRYRSGYAKGDIDRLDAQKKFLAALFETVKKQISAENAYGIASSVVRAVDTDVGLAMGVALGLEAINVDSSKLYFFTLPGEAAVSRRSGASYYVMSAKPAQRILTEYFGKEAEGIDVEKSFSHPSYKEFIRIYEKDSETLPKRADELK